MESDAAHGGALNGRRISLATKRALRESPLSMAAAARAFGVNKKTVQLWRRRELLERRKAEASQSLSLTRDEEAIVIHFRVSHLLPLDDCLYVLKAEMPHITRSTLHRCFVRHGVNKLPIDQFYRDTIGPDGAPRPGNLLLQTHVIEIMGRRARVLSTTDLPSRMSYGAVYELDDLDSLKRYAALLPTIYPFPVDVLTVPLCDELHALDPDLAWLREFTQSHGIRCIVRPADYPWEPAQIERVHARLGELRQRGDVFPSVQAAHDHIARFTAVSNFKRKLKTLGARTPFAFACAASDFDKFAYRRTIRETPDLSAWWGVLGETSD